MRSTSASFLWAVFAGLFVAACSAGAPEGGALPADEGARGNETARLADHLFLGDAVTVGNLTVWPVHTDAPLDVGEFVTLQEGQQKGTALVREVGGGGGQQQLAQGMEIVDEPFEGPSTDAPSGVRTDAHGEIRVEGAQGLGGGATVGTLVVENKGELPLLIVAGTVVKGGNQDRQIGQDIVVAAGQTVPVDAFCVEAGRWTNERLGEATNGRFAAVEGAMAPAKVRAKGQYLKDQSEVWEEVAVARQSAFLTGDAGGGSRGRQARGNVVTSGSPAGTTLVDALEAADPKIAERQERAANTVAAHFEKLAAGDSPPVGFAYAINGQPVTVRSFAHARLMRQYFDPFVRTMALEAQMAVDEVEDYEPPTARSVVALVDRINRADEKLESTRASNENGVRQNDAGFNSNCYFDEDGKKVPLTQDWTRR